MKVISLFAWAWWLDLGFALAWHEIVWANDFDEDALKTYEKNFKSFNKHKIILWDIVKYLNQNEDTLKKEIPDADIVIWWFPCQWFSIANINRTMQDERNYLYLQVLKMIKLKEPKFILLENVKWLENIEKWKVLSMILNDIENTWKWYTVFYNVINALNYGVPQNRERIIIFWVRNDYADKIKLPISSSINPKHPKKDTKHSNNTFRN